MFSIILLSAFLALMIGIGIWGMRKTKTLNDFFLGGRSVGPWISALAYGTTYFSAVLFIGFAGKQGWLFGFNALWISFGNAFLGAFLAWIVLGRRTRIMTQNLATMTMPEFLQERYGAKYLKLISAAIIFMFLLPYSASVFKGLGHLFEASFHINYDVALLIMIGITGIYLVLGGYFAITLTDFIQGVIMFFGSIAMVSILIGKAGGVTEAIRTASEAYDAHIPPNSRPDIITILSLVFMTSFGTWGLPQMVQKFYAIKSEKLIRKAAIATGVFATVIVFSAYLSGALSHVFFTPETVPRLANGAVNYDSIMPNLLSTQLPEALMALILLLILSASMSTLSSLVLVSSSAVVIDLFGANESVEGQKKRSVAAMRALSAIFVVISYFISRYQFGFIVTLMSLSWGAIAGSFLAPYFYGLFWKKTTKAAAYAGLFSGLALSITLFFILGAARSPLAASIAMIVPFIVVPVVSAFTKAPDKERISKAYEGI